MFNKRVTFYKSVDFHGDEIHYVFNKNNGEILSINSDVMSAIESKVIDVEYPEISEYLHTNKYFAIKTDENTISMHDRSEDVLIGLVSESGFKETVDELVMKIDENNSLEEFSISILHKNGLADTGKLIDKIRPKFERINVFLDFEMFEELIEKHHSTNLTVQTQVLVTDEFISMMDTSLKKITSCLKKMKFYSVDTILHFVLEKKDLDKIVSIQDYLRKNNLINDKNLSYSLRIVNAFSDLVREPVCMSHSDTYKDYLALLTEFPQLELFNLSSSPPVVKMQKFMNYRLPISTPDFYCDAYSNNYIQHSNGQKYKCWNMAFNGQLNDNQVGKASTIVSVKHDLNEDCRLCQSFELCKGGCKLNKEISDCKWDSVFYDFMEFMDKNNMI